MTHTDKQIDAAALAIINKARADDEDVVLAPLSSLSEVYWSSADWARETARAALEAAERAAWRPISEAPKDGTHILAVDGYGAMYRAWWNGESFSAHCGQPVVDTPEPTHFRPLPAPPEGTPA